MKKTEQHKLAKQLRSVGIKLNVIGEAVANAAGRKKAYSVSTMSEWLSYETYEGYIEHVRERNNKEINNQEKSGDQFIYIANGLIDHFIYLEDKVAELYQDIRNISKKLQDPSKEELEDMYKVWLETNKKG